MAKGMQNFAETLQFLGAGMAGGNVGASLGQLAELRQARQQLQAQQQWREQQMAASEQTMAMQRQEAERQAKQREALAAIAPTVSAEMFPEQAAMQQYLAQSPQLLQKAIAQRMATPQPIALQQQVEYAMSLPEGSPERTLAMEKLRGQPLVQIGSAAGPERGAVPQGMARIEDPISATGTRLVPEPGAPTQEKAKQAAETARKKQLAPLNAMQDSINRYKRLLKETGPEIVPGPAKSSLMSAYTDLLMKQKEAANLGALTGPDLELMQGMLSDPTTIGAQIQGPKALEAQIGQAETALSDARARVEGKEPEVPPPIAPGAQPTLGVGAAAAAELAGAPTISSDAEFDALPSGAQFMGPDGVLRRKP